MKTVTLASLAAIPFEVPPHAEKYSHFIPEARATLERQKMRYEPATGTTRSNAGRYSRPVSAGDISVYESPEEILKWEFGGWICNAASRLSRGYKAC